MYTRLGYLLILAGCGPAEPADTSGSAGQSTGATSSTTGASSTDEITGPTSTAGASAGATSTGSTAGETGEASVTADTTDTTDTTGAAATTTGESSTGEPGGVVYTAEYYIGQINRISVFRADFDADNCAVIKFAEGGADPNAPVTLPPPWQLEWTHVVQGTSGCLAGEPAFAWEAPEGVMGMADFVPAMPCTIDIDVIATFPQTEPWVPMEIHFLATGVPVEGAC